MNIDVVDDKIPKDEDRFTPLHYAAQYGHTEIVKMIVAVVEDKNSKVGVNTHSTNKIVLDALQNNLIDEFKNITNIKPETKFGANTRFDFLISSKKNKIFIEVKNVTLSRKKNIAEFPDAITSRGTKHLKELINAKKKGYESYILYLIQREDCKFFKIAKDIDEEYKNTFDDAIRNGVKVLCYDCKLSNEDIKINNQIYYEK